MVTSEIPSAKANTDTAARNSCLAGLLPYAGFRYSAVNASMASNPQDGEYFWPNGYRYGWNARPRSWRLRYGLSTATSL